jgi:DNA-binding HxlR family transcriptional regulator
MVHDAFMTGLVDRYKDEIAGVLSCFDRLILQGRIPVWSYADGMTRFLTARNVKIFDFIKWASPLTDAIKEHAEAVAAQAGLQADFVRKKNFRKEQRIEEVLKERGKHPGLVWVFSALEPCTTYAPKYSPKRKAYLVAKDKKCLHYYFYFIDEEFGLCYLRVPTWAPFRLQFYCNLHNWLATQLNRAGIENRLLDNAFVHVGNWTKAQEIVDGFEVASLHAKLDQWVKQYCPALLQFEENHNWTLDTAEYATDVVFHRQADLQGLYGEWVRTAIHTVKPRDIATFLGKKLSGNYQGEMGNRYNTRIEGTRIRHSMGMVSIKMYDKFGQILRIETTVKDVTFFRHYREVEQRDGSRVYRYAAMKKTLYSLGALREATTASNRRYLAFVMQLEDPRASLEKLDRVTRKVSENQRSYRGFNFYDEQDREVLESIGQGEFCISGMQNKTLRKLLPGRSTQQVSRTIKRLRTHGLVKKTAHSYKYYLTPLGREVVAAGLRLKQFVILPEFRKDSAA